MEDPPIEGSAGDGPAGEDSAAAGSTSRNLSRRTAIDGRSLHPRATLRADSSARWRNISLGLGLVAAIMIGGTGELVFSALTSGPAPTSGTGSPVASPATASPTQASQAPTTVGPTPTAGASATAGPTETAGASSTLGPDSTATDTTTPAPQVGGTPSPATITFREMMLDSAADSAATARTFAFTSDGPGPVSAQVVAAAPLATLKMCIQVNGGPQSCSSGATPGFFTMAPSSGDQAQWIVTLIATDAGATPVVDVAFTWQTRAPAITLSHGRFQGAPNPDSLCGFTATFKPRAAGSVGVIASWPPASADAALTLTDATSSPGSSVGTTTYSATGLIAPAYAHAVAAGRTYQIQLLNTGSDSGRPDLTTTISFP